MQLEVQRTMLRTFLVALVFGVFIQLCSGCGPVTVSVPPPSGSAVQDPTTTTADVDRSAEVIPIESATPTQESADRQNDPSELKPDAEKVLAAALDQAQREDKRLLVHIGAPW
jgi:hypothetical protein